MTEDKAHRLLGAVSQRTLEGGIAWTEASDEGSYLASFPKYSIIVRGTRFQNHRGEVQDGAELDLIDETGRVMDTIYPHRLDSGYDDPVEIAMSIYGRAKDTALGVDQAVDELLKELEPKPKPSGYDDTLNEEEIPF